MSKILPPTNLFVFRRDLRIEDNTALNQALSTGLPVITAFIIDPRQFDPHPYRSEFSLRFLKESLVELAQALELAAGKLQIWRGIAEDLIPELLKTYNCKALFFNRDYTPFSRLRDGRIEERARAMGVEFHGTDDALINAPQIVTKDDRKPYTIFTPFYKKALKLTAPVPENRPAGTFYAQKLADTVAVESLLHGLAPLHAESSPGGRNAALKILENLGQYSRYNEDRNIPSVPGTTRLGPHHKFGTISIRESLARSTSLFGRDSALVRELYWRDFFTQIAFNFPHVFERSFNAPYDRVEWHDNPDLFSAWCAGETGFPLVDAGMRELNETGFMHNRVRMVVASFLTKDLHLHWQLGERYFAQKLVDYDPAVNNGSWQWAASTGCDAQPYFRIFNPWLQQQRFEQECLYIKKWVPELRELSAKEIHGLAEKRPLFIKNYPTPVVEHSREKRITEEMFQKALGK